MAVTPAGLHVPISREERMRAINARREKMEASYTTPQSEALERELRELDDRLRVIYVDPAAGQLLPAERGPGMIPGRWHVKLLAHPANVYYPLTGPDWEYSEPGLFWVERFKERDLWRRGALEEIRKAEDKEEEERLRHEANESEARVEQFAASLRAARRVKGDGGEFRRFDRKGTPPKKKTESLVLPAGVKP